MKLNNLVIEELRNLEWEELKDTIYNDLLELSIDQVFNIKRKVLKKIDEDRVKEEDKKLYNDVNIILYGNVKVKDYHQNKERYDKHTDYMLNQLPKDLTASKKFHKERERKLRIKNPKLATYHMRMFRSLQQQGY